MLKQSFEVAMLSYDVTTMCRLIRLMAYNHVRDKQFIEMVEDALCMRVATSLKSGKPTGID